MEIVWEIATILFSDCPILTYNFYDLILRYSSEMAKKSCIVGLPVVPFNQNKISDVCQYLQWLQDLLYKVFKNEVTKYIESITLV